MPSYYGMVWVLELLTLLAKNIRCACEGITPSYYCLILVFGVTDLVS